MWTCSKCGEPIEPQFDACWNCGTSNTGVEDPDFPSETPTVDEASARRDRSPPQFTLMNLLALMTGASVLFGLLRLTIAYPPLIVPIIGLLCFFIFLAVWTPNVAR
jgi:hypothetical protein